MSAAELVLELRALVLLSGSGSPRPAGLKEPATPGLLEDQLHARGINLHILTGICAGLHRPAGATIADKMLFMVAAMAAEMERDLIRERTLDGLRAAEAQGRRGGRPTAVDEDVLALARSRQARGESITTIARHLGIGRSPSTGLTQSTDQAN